MNTQSPYLREQRQFPFTDIKDLANQSDQSYVDIASKVNARIIGTFALNAQTATGERWYLQGQPKPQQTLRQIYKFSDGNLTIAHGIKFSSLTNFTIISGTFFDGTNWCTLPYIDVTAANNQINVKVNSSSIVITKGSGSPPSIQNGLLIIQWLSNY